MKKILFLFSALLLFSCSGGDDLSNVDNSTDTGSNSSNNGNNSNNLYTIELKKIFKSKQYLNDGSRFGYNNEYGTGWKKHCSLDTLIIDFDLGAYVRLYTQFDYPYEYVKYIKVLNYTPNKKLYFSNDFQLDREINCTSGMIFSAWFNGNVMVRHDAMGYFDSNLTVEEINSITDLSSTNGNQPFIKVSPTYENEFRELKMYKQPFDFHFPRGLSVGDLINYSTMIQDCDGDNGYPIYDSEYEVLSISIE